jgi:tetratricopeptide (TPR) repeat protein
MDWITLLRSLQSDFIQRLTNGCLLHCQTEGQHSELTIISGERLKTLRDFCWQMAEKYKRTSTVRDVFVSNLKGKLGEEVVKERLGNFITEIDYEKRWGGDGKVDFTLTANPTIGVEVKSRHGTINQVRWSVSAEEVEKNAVVVCILIQEEVNEAQSQYHLFLAGFLPTQMIKLKTGKISFGIHQLLYGGGLFPYLDNLLNPHNVHQPLPANVDKGIPIKPHLDLIPEPNVITPMAQQGDQYLQTGDYLAAINSYNQALVNNHDYDTYYKLGLVYYQLGDYTNACSNYTQAINLNIYDAKIYHHRGLAYYQLNNYQSAIEDYTQAIRINPHVAIFYKNRADAYYQIGNIQAAIEDYTQALKLNPHYAVTQKNRGLPSSLLEPQNKLVQLMKIAPDDALGYKHRGNQRCDLGDYEGAIADYTQAITINSDDLEAYYNRGNVYADLGKYPEAIADYTQAIQLNYHYADAYYNRGNARLEMGDKEKAIEDFDKAANLYWQNGKLAEHQETKARILDLEIEASLDILNF